jgi:hypothetical protein
MDTDSITSAAQAVHSEFQAVHLELVGGLRPLAAPA